MLQASSTSSEWSLIYDLGKSNQKQLPQKDILKRSVLPLLTHNYRRRLWHGGDEMGSEDEVSPDFLLLSTNNTEFAEKWEGHEGVGTSHCQVASDLLQLAQAGLQFSCYVVYRKNQKDNSLEVTSDSAACFLQKSSQAAVLWQQTVLCCLCFQFWFHLFSFNDSLLSYGDAKRHKSPI